MKKTHKAFLVLFLIAIPFVIFGQDPLIETGGDVIDIVNNITRWLWQLFAAATVLVFLIAGFYYITATGNPQRIEKANNMVKYGIIGVIVALLSAGMAELIKNIISVD